MSRTSSPPVKATIGVVSTLVWAADVNRLPTWIQNAGPGSVAFVSGGAATSDGWNLLPGEALELDTSLALYAIADAVGTTLKLWPGLSQHVGGGGGGVGGDDGYQVVAALASRPEVRVVGITGIPLPDGTVADPVVVSIGGGAGASIETYDSTAQALLRAFQFSRGVADPTMFRSLRAGDFTVTRTSDTRLTFAGMATVPTLPSQLVYVYGAPADGQPTTEVVSNGPAMPTLTWVAAAGGGTLDRATGVWPLAITGCVWCVARTAYAVATDSSKVTEQDPLDTHYDPITLVDASNIGAASNYYPSSAGQSHTPAGRKSLSIAGAASGGVTVTVEITNDPSAVPVWQDITKACLEGVTNTYDNASFVDPASIALYLESLQCLAWRLKCVTADATNALEFYAVANSL